MLLLEYNKEFCRQLQERYNGYDNIILINDSAENADKYLQEQNISKVDYVVSGLPFASLPKNILDKILRKTRNILKDKFEYERGIENTKNELITNVSHDLRTPLTAIIGYLDILKHKKYKNSEENMEYITSAYNLSIKLKRLINELFEYTKLSGSGITLEIEEVDLSSILVQMLGEYTPALEAEGLRIIADIAEEIPVEVDIEKIVRVFDNILSNAEKYSVKPSDIIVKAKNKADAVYVAISNKSEHIEQDKLSKIFEKFYRADISRSSNVEGSGLELAISEKIVQLHKGEIWAECYEDIITIYIKLPISSPL